MTLGRLFLATAAVWTVLDQATKAVVMATMGRGESISVIPGFFSLTHIHNSGIAFGLFNDGSAGTAKIVLLTLATLASLAAVAWFLRDLAPGDHLGAVALGLVAGGAVGNLIDRLRLGEVVDFLDVYWRSHHWPAFNVADSGITVGVILLLGGQLLIARRES